MVIYLVRSSSLFGWLSINVVGAINPETRAGLKSARSISGISIGAILEATP